MVMIEGPLPLPGKGERKRNQKKIMKGKSGI
jgi:hypothetical protein